MQRSLWILANSALLLALVVVLLGGWTRLNYAGLGCPDWPGCYGSLILPSEPDRLQQAQSAFPDHPIDTYKGWLEMTHRYAAGTLGLLILGIAIISYKVRKTEFSLGYLPTLLLILVIMQALFGMWTVTLKLLPPIVTLHLLGGLLTLTLLFMLQARLRGIRNDLIPAATEKARRSDDLTPSGITAANNTPANNTIADTGAYTGPGIRLKVFIGVILLFFQLALGGWTSANYAGWACSDWIVCHQDINVTLDFARGFELTTDLEANYEGGLLPLEARAAIQMTHRVMALLLISYLLWLAWNLQKLSSAFKRPLQLVLLLSITQAGLGVANVIWAVPLPLATAHHAGAVCLLLAMLWLYQRSTRFSKGGTYAAL
ncbi:COX15/CtaA family protein [Neptunomonas qingdaonensis]|uniref:Cytochrome c oxidase assembly protein subunit 15 n=1 Tax=Neptunomonas qingdaonensis TaxID=1045558 RepID=A0A1I2M913_9GAMM|nr:COX15/CtaA family protein [Neptunomonas qingdaonensis]SFF85701.1 cytochrome c oxidase assembly protein subunit 15 [Neptunomonas qingdaonensis]